MQQRAKMLTHATPRRPLLSASVQSPSAATGYGYQHFIQVAELRRRLRSAEAGRDAAAGEAAELRATASAVSADKAAVDVALSEARATLAARNETVGLTAAAA